MAHLDSAFQSAPQVLENYTNFVLKSPNWGEIATRIDCSSSFRSKVRLNDIKCDNVMLIIERIWRKNKNSLQPPTSRTRKPKVFVFSEANQETMN